jgi:hypothetical protein
VGCNSSLQKDARVRQIKIIVEKHSDGSVADPLGMKGIVVGEDDTYEGALVPGRASTRPPHPPPHHPLAPGIQGKSGRGGVGALCLPVRSHADQRRLREIY